MNRYTITLLLAIIALIMAWLFVNRAKARKSNRGSSSITQKERPGSGKGKEHAALTTTVKPVPPINAILTLPAPPRIKNNSKPYVNWKNLSPRNLAVLKKHVIPTVYEPVGDGFPLKVPKVLGNRKLANMGMVDVTAAPFYADPTGKHDSTNAIQSAVIFSRNWAMVCFFPPGTYLVSDTISCMMRPYQRTSGPVSGGDNFACILVGSRRNPGKRPRILLAANSPGFQDPKHRKYVLEFWAFAGYLMKRNENPLARSRAAAVNYNQLLVNLDVTIGKGNPAAVGIRHNCAQGSGIQDCTVNATHGLCGIEGGAGNGGGFFNLKVIGGKIGIDLGGGPVSTRPGAVMAGITLIGQTRTALRYNGLESISIAGLKIVANIPGPLVTTTPQFALAPISGCHMSFVDCEIRFDKADPQNTIFATGSNLYVKNLYASRAAFIMRNPDASSVAGNPTGWLRVTELAHAPRYRAVSSPVRKYVFTSPIYINGTRRQSPFVTAVKDLAPQHDVRADHVWSQPFVHWEMDGVANVKQPPYDAKGDAKVDDTDALQRAIDASEAVFLPKGYYRITRTLRLHEKTKLFGVGGTLSTILSGNKLEGDFADIQHPRPLIETPDSTDTSVTLAFVSLCPSAVTPAAYAIKWQSGGQALLRSCRIFPIFYHGFGGGMPGDWDHPLVLITGHGGGSWYNFDSAFRGKGNNYRHLLIRDCTGPLSLYACTLEHAMGDAQMEILRGSNVDIFALKAENNHPTLRVTDSNNINVFGFGGNTSAFSGKALFYLKNSAPVTLVNVLTRIMLPKKGKKEFGGNRGRIAPPEQWHMIEDVGPDGKRLATQPLERPVLFRRTVY